MVPIYGSHIVSLVQIELMAPKRQFEIDEYIKEVEFIPSNTKRSGRGIKTRVVRNSNSPQKPKRLKRVDFSRPSPPRLGIPSTASSSQLGLDDPPDFPMVDGEPDYGTDGFTHRLKKRKAGKVGGARENPKAIHPYHPKRHRIRRYSSGYLIDTNI